MKWIIKLFKKNGALLEHTTISNISFKKYRDIVLTNENSYFYYYS